MKKLLRLFCGLILSYQGIAMNPDLYYTWHLRTIFDEIDPEVQVKDINRLYGHQLAALPL